MSAAVAVEHKTIRKTPLPRMILQFLLHALVAFGALVFAYPFLWMVTSSVKPGYEMMLIYVMWARLGFVNTYVPLLAPEYLGSPFVIFLLRQYMMTIPLEMDDAARIDGCGWFGLFWRIILPLSGPVLGVAAIYSFTF